MVNSNHHDGLIIKNDQEYCFFDFCEHHKLNIEMTHREGNRCETIRGCINGFNPKKSMLSIKSRQGYDHSIPLSHILSITIKGN